MLSIKQFLFQADAKSTDEVSSNFWVQSFSVPLNGSINTVFGNKRKPIEFGNQFSMLWEIIT